MSGPKYMRYSLSAEELQRLLQEQLERQRQEAIRKEKQRMEKLINAEEKNRQKNICYIHSYKILENSN